MSVQISLILPGCNLADSLNRSLDNDRKIFRMMTRLYLRIQGN